MDNAGKQPGADAPGLTVAPGVPVIPILPELDPYHSRTVTAPDAHGVRRVWHVLDSRSSGRGSDQHDGGPITATLICVHGNPTWSYLWRRVIDAAPPGWRVIAPDHLGMGYSEKPEQPRTLAERVDDLTRLLDTLDITGPVYLLAHDWGGPIGLGWATDVVRRSSGRTTLAGVVLTNTAVHQPEDAPEPAAIRLAHTPGIRALSCRLTPTFVRATTALSRGNIPREVRNSYAAPYQGARRRQAVADFVADIPFRSDHPSAATLDRIAAGLSALGSTPTLLVWGLRDPVFAQRYLDDLRRRLPHADVHRYARASHLVLEDAPEGVDAIWQWLTEQQHAPRPAEDARELAAGQPKHRDSTDSTDDQVDGVPIEINLEAPDSTAIVELGEGGRHITFAGLAERVAAVAAGLAARGVKPGQRVAVLVPPGIDLTTLVYASWRLGAIVVVADAGLGVRRLGAALRGAAPDHLIAIRRGLLLAKAARVPGRHHRFEREDAIAIAHEGLRAGVDATPPVATNPEDDGAILFTSGATGPPKGVVYTRGRLSAQVALLRDTFDLHPGTRFVAAFAPFALYGAALGLPSAVPDMDVTAPHTLTSTALAEAAERIGADVVFASPAALRNVAATADVLTGDGRAALRDVRLLLSAGAPVPVSLLHRIRDLMPSAATHTPYGMTEALPVATIDPTQHTPSAEDDDPDGVCVGRPLDQVTVRLAPLDPDGTPSRDPATLTEAPGVLGEVVVSGPHIKSRYDGLWATTRASEHPPGWHRTGDVGEFDAAGRLWVQGRLAHVAQTSAGAVPPYGIEQRLEGVEDVEAAAVVGVGPPGTQQLVAIVVPTERLPRITGTPLAPSALAARVRRAAGVDLAAVLQRDWLPVDVRHASKVDRSNLALWATRWLHGRQAAGELGGTGLAPATRSR